MSSAKTYEPDLLADGGNNQVGVAGWNELRIAGSEAKPPETSTRHRPDRMRNLINTL